MWEFSQQALRTILKIFKPGNNDNSESTNQIKWNRWLLSWDFNFLTFHVYISRLQNPSVNLELKQNDYTNGSAYKRTGRLSRHHFYQSDGEMSFFTNFSEWQLWHGMKMLSKWACLIHVNREAMSGKHILFWMKIEFYFGLRCIRKRVVYVHRYVNIQNHVFYYPSHFHIALRKHKRISQWTSMSVAHFQK